ncbi:MAG TPA: YbhB/YbcL family Raf kinase inhibitor-like protein [Candidatus Omnitrophota bacterium]|nr:YbhB/YbcL family Raf kinase inhibitor-like protein [Candidatus Omnitrophota bacterium]
MKILKLFGVTIVSTMLFICPGYGQREGNMPSKIAMTSPSFRNGEMLPREHTCDGSDISPALQWSGIPEATQSLALISDDPDAPAGDWVHWVVYDLPPLTTSLPAGVPSLEKLPMGGTQGRTDFGRVGYGGPCPPSGTHRYFFKIYALDVKLHLPPGRTKKELLAAMQGHILAEGQLMGKYQREKVARRF